MKTLQNAALFVYGCLLQLCVVWWTIHWVFRLYADITMLPALLAVSVACGGFYFWFFTRETLLGWRGHSEGYTSFRFIGRVSLRSVYALGSTWETVELVYSFYLGAFTPDFLHPRFWQRLGFVLHYLLDLHLWVAIVIAFGIPIALVGGSLAGAIVIAARRRGSSGISLQ